MAGNKISRSDQRFIKVLEETSSPKEAMDALGLKDERSFRRRRKNIEDKYGITLPRFVRGAVRPTSTDPETLTREAQLLKRNQELGNEVARLRELTADAAEMKRLIHDCVSREPEPPNWLYKCPYKKSGRVHGIPTLFLSDLHWDEVVHPSQINYVNEFSREIAIVRLKKVFDTTVYLCKEVLSDSPYEGIVLALGGDMFSGYIHEELRENKSGTLFDGVMNLTDNIAAGIEMLADEFGKVFVPCVTGNHGRLDRKPRMKNGVQDNVDWLLYHLLKRHFTGRKEIQFLIPDSSDAYYRIHDVRYMLTHGNQFRGGAGIAGPATPWALGDHKKRKRQNAINQPYDTLIFGHFHMLSWGPNNSYIVNGSLKGYDEYAFNSNFGFEPPKQALWMTHPEHGITHKMEVFADEAKEASRERWVSVMDEE